MEKLVTPHLSQTMDAGALVFVSGQLALDSAGQIQGEDVATQTRKTLDNLKSRLAACDLTLADIVKTTVFLTRADDFVAFNNAYAEVFGDHRPTRSTVVVALALPTALVEIEAIACRRA